MKIKIASIAWRNVWRHKLRSSVILSAVAIGICAGVFSWAFYTGMMNQRVETAIATESSNIQIHQPGYLEDPEIKKFLVHGYELTGEISRLPGIKGVSGRILANAMATSAEQGTGVIVVGIDPEKDKKVTNIYSKITKGNYLENSGHNPVIIGKKLAQKLKVKERSKIILTLQQTDGTLTKAQFRVAGIYDITNNVYEEMNIFVNAKDLSELLQLQSGVYQEIAVKVTDNAKEMETFDLLRTKYPALDVKSWRELMPEVSVAEESIDISMIIFMIVILAGLSLAIVNTMLMAVLERIKEIGMLMAIGMNRKRIFRMILLETTFLTFTGTAIGIVIAVLLSAFFHHTGIDISMGTEVYESLGYDSFIYPVLSPKIVIYVTFMVILASILSAIYPALKALRLKPADAIRSDV
jgi:ABC-type lipoprotein release transport system permease subunit